uniref:Thiamine biosynthesis protein S n=1 Tax=Toxarium undulatum TaxID=210620 RepID=A0A1D8D9K9_9STRA|nr:thiamine biosynthesis protein S [Toxarium undulatum]AOS86635.1 thiamine biosynthesis protein S [Toxarium undulatum]
MQKKNKHFFLNGKKYYTNKNKNLKDIINYFNYNSSLLIIEHNYIIRNKKDWSKIIIKNNDKIEIITIVGGG